MEEKVVFGNYGSWRAKDWYKGLAPLDVDTSLLSSLSDCLKESCVLVTKLPLLYSILSRSSTLSISLLTRSPFLTHASAEFSLAPVVQLSDTAAF
jgi:hypothetical protein